MLFSQPPKYKYAKKDTKYRQYQYNFHGRILTLQGYEKQALEYLVKHKKLKPAEIKHECEFKDALTIDYTYAKRRRKYHPDIYITSKRCVVEVKSLHTLGILSNKKRGWSMTRAKAKATIKAGYLFMLLVMDDEGNRIKLPKEWYNCTKEECKAFINKHSKKSNYRLIEL